MRKVDERVMWNGNVHQLFVDDNQIVARDVMLGRQVQAILDENTRNRNDGWNRKAQGRIFARVPNTVLHEWRRKWKAEYSDKWTWPTYKKILLAQPEYRHFLTGHYKRV